MVIVSGVDVGVKISVQKIQIYSLYVQGMCRFNLI